ncbi:hypothetical protein J132_06931 [Termitomyces sp. J132]|nr:hypothetical protein J132_06931 [Termitomyces sp. J132]
MAKSIRSKTKRTFRNKKREDSVYAVTEAARLHRLNSKLTAIVSKDSEGDVPVQEQKEGEDCVPGWPEFFLTLSIYPYFMSADAMSVDTEPRKSISTHGPRGSRREEWRLSKGLDPKPRRDGMNRKGDLSGRRKAGRAKRRR